MRDKAKKKYVFNTALILTLLYVSALLPLSGFSCTCDAADASQNIEKNPLSPCCCSSDACSENAPAKPIRVSDPLCAPQDMCCCLSANDDLFHVQTAAVKHERRGSLKDERCALVLPAVFMPPPAAALCAPVMRLSECRPPVSPHISTTILLL